jgi:hypothetical protein
MDHKKYDPAMEELKPGTKVGVVGESQKESIQFFAHKAELENYKKQKNEYIQFIGKCYPQRHY